MLTGWYSLLRLEGVPLGAPQAPHKLFVGFTRPIAPTSAITKERHQRNEAIPRVPPAAIPRYIEPPRRIYNPCVRTEKWLHGRTMSLRLILSSPCVLDHSLLVLFCLDLFLVLPPQHLTATSHGQQHQ